MDFNIDKLIKENVTNKYDLIKYKDILITNEEVSILDKYDINYKRFNNIKELIFEIENYLNDDYFEDLEYVSMNLSERDYYKNTNK